MQRHDDYLYINSECDSIILVFYSRVRELEEELEETKRSTKVTCSHIIITSVTYALQATLESVSNQLMEKTRELANVQLDREKLRVSDIE